jgi:hypothetical protein
MIFIGIKYYHMIQVDTKIIEILEVDFGINRSNISDCTNLINEFDWCEWELDLLYSKLEIAFNIEIHHEAQKDNICLKELQRKIGESIEGSKALSIV